MYSMGSKSKSHIYYLGSSLFFYQTRMPEMAFSALLSCTNGINTPFQKSIKTLIRVRLINLPIAPDESLKLGKELGSDPG